VRVFVSASTPVQKQEAQTALTGLDESVEESHGKRHCTLVSAPSETDIPVQAHSADPDDLMFPTQINHFSVLDAPLPEAGHTVTAHDLSMLKVCYPRLFAGGG